ncbi:MAG: hypothetical protein JO366_20570 [Methylobacteriaceae bacterium]|nr:hypothetical protein [Methylobacteriaceae bacterium]MBV9247199.1 hypothetical protein [Methylobacteriaceae bacterium]MBV9636125.1 hypothetical protein [Methylobacteriaceae bacterium]
MKKPRETPNIVMNEAGIRSAFNELIGAVVTMAKAVRREVFSPAEKERIREAVEALTDLYRKK